MDLRDLYRRGMLFAFNGEMGIFIGFIIGTVMYVFWNVFVNTSTSKSQRSYSYRYPKNLISRFFLTKRHRYVRSILHHSRNLDIGCGLYKITDDSVGLDMKGWKRPDIVGSVMDIPFPDQSFDSVTLLELFEHFDPLGQERMVHELNRVLRNGGQLILSMPNMSPFWSIPYRIIWWLWERAVMNEYIHEHVGMVPHHALIRLLVQNGFLIVRIHREALLDVIIEAWKVRTRAIAYVRLNRNSKRLGMKQS